MPSPYLVLCSPVQRGLSLEISSIPFLSPLPVFEPPPLQHSPPSIVPVCAKEHMSSSKRNNTLLKEMRLLTSGNWDLPEKWLQVSSVIGCK